LGHGTKLALFLSLGKRLIQVPGACQGIACCRLRQELKSLTLSFLNIVVPKARQSELQKRLSASKNCDRKITAGAEIRRARYVGDSSTFRIKIEYESVILGSGEHYKELTVDDLSVPFGRISDVQIDGSLLTIICAKGHKCIDDHVVSNPDAEMSCDNAEGFCEPGGS
jgi:hypothetical protein